MQLRRQNVVLGALSWFALLGLFGMGASGFGAIGSAAIVDVEYGRPVARVTAEVLRPALAWDFGFILLYSVLPALVLMRGGLKRPRGLVLGVVLLAAGLCDVVENVLLWRAERLPTSAAAPYAQAKFDLLGLVAAGAVVSGGLAAWRRRRSRPAARPARKRPAPSTGDAPPPRPPDLPESCALVMKGGITSGVVYPRAIERIARDFRLECVGGSSAGAIAAVTGAAAELQRLEATRAGVTGDDRVAGFTRLGQLEDDLARPGFLFGLFAPDALTLGVFTLITSVMNGRVWPIWKALLRWWPWFLAGALVAIPLGLLAAGGGAGGWSAVLMGVVPALALGLVAVVAGVILATLDVLPRNAFGLVKARGEDGDPTLTRWLTAVIDEIAWGKVDEARAPVCFGDLWFAGKGVDWRPPAAKAERQRLERNPRARSIDLRVLTTSLTHGRPFRVPFETREFLWSPSELREWFPERVVKAMEQACPAWKGPKKGAPDDLRFWPFPEFVPVVVAARLSLSFPFLLAAVPVWTPSWKEKPRALDPKRADDELSEQVTGVVKVWLSDGGISSNFPIHFFDEPIPTRPTFGLDLWEVEDGHHGPMWEVAHSNAQGWRPKLAAKLARGGAAAFGGALVDAAQAFMDNMQARLPGYRDCVARVLLRPNEGGLNLNMPPERVTALAERGERAADELVRRYTEGDGWARHRWMRLRSTMALFEEHVQALEAGLDGVDVATVGKDCGYPMTEAQRRRLATLKAELGKLALPRDGSGFKRDDELDEVPDELVSRESLDDGNVPRPRPELRTVPKV